jgi:hypothetical protein
MGPKKCLLIAAAALLLLASTPAAASASLRAAAAADAASSVTVHADAPVPKPPCFSPYSPLETSCSRTLAMDRRTNVTIREYEAAGATITFLTATEAGQLDYQQGLEACVALFITYFVPGFNQELRPVNRTVPIVTTHIGSPSDPFNYKWASGMALPASVYPTSATAPVPDDPVFLQFIELANPLVAVHHFVTPALAADADWAAAVAFLTANVPRGYSAVAGTAPVFAIYDGRAATTLRNNEVWLSVERG